MSTSIHAHAAAAAKQPLQPFEYQPGPLGPNEVEVRVTHCGICHSDVAMVDNDWGISTFPVVPGHEVVGTVEAVGAAVGHLKVGQRVGVGWQCGSCGQCEWCRRGADNFCPFEKDTIVAHHGGFADRVRCEGRFAIPIPDELDSAEAAPLMCAGNTVFSPLLHYHVEGWMRTAVVGVGGLGHLAVQYLRALGSDVTAISTTRSKESESRRLGAGHFIATNESGAMAKAANQFDFILSTVSADVNWTEYVSALRPQGTLCIAGVPDSDLKCNAFPLILGERRLCGARTGGTEDLRAMLAFTARHGVKPIIERFPMAEANAALDHVRKGKARYRAVLVA